MARACYVCQKGLAEFAARRPQMHFKRFFRRRARRKKHFARSEVSNWDTKGVPTEARNTAKPIVKKGLWPFFDSLNRPAPDGAGLFLCAW